jgi:hypothetical protein
MEQLTGEIDHLCTRISNIKRLSWNMTVNSQVR